MHKPYVHRYCSPEGDEKQKAEECHQVSELLSQWESSQEEKHIYYYVLN